MYSMMSCGLDRNNDCLFIHLFTCVAVTGGRIFCWPPFSQHSHSHLHTSTSCTVFSSCFSFFEKDNKSWQAYLEVELDYSNRASYRCCLFFVSDSKWLMVVSRSHYNTFTDIRSNTLIMLEDLWIYFLYIRIFIQVSVFHVSTCSLHLPTQHKKQIYTVSDLTKFEFYFLIMHFSCYSHMVTWFCIPVFPVW